MSSKYLLQGWKLSFYTAKLYSYLSYKQIPFQLHRMNLLDLQYHAPRKVGASVMPILYNNETKKYSQDTHDIIMELEKSYPNRPVIPPKTDPKQYFLAYLLAAWFDECWVASAMYHRWMFPESVEFFKKEAHQSLFNSLIPPFMGAPLVNKICNTLISYLPAVGVRKEQFEMVESWTSSTFHHLNAHFAAYDYLLGTEEPTLADIALCGPLLAHLYRDPYPKTHVIAAFPYVQEYAERMLSHSPGWKDETGEISSKVERGNNNKKTARVSVDIPPTLLPIIQQIFFEFVPLIEATQEEAMKLVQHPKFGVAGQGRSLPRALGEVTMPMKHDTNSSFKRSALPFNIWKFQQASQAFQSLDGKAQQSILTWLQAHQIHNTSLLTDTSSFPTLKRTALSVKFT